MRAELLVLVGPSGAGKTTIANRLVRDRPVEFMHSVSVTTRRPRAGERPGREYHFATRDEFKAMIVAGALVEWAEVHDEFYGTPARNLSGDDEPGPLPVLDIDVQGAMQVIEHAPSALVIFILPPGPRRWIGRLVERGTESPRQILRRLRTALRELRAAPSFNEFIVNEDLDLAVEQILAISHNAVGRRSCRAEMDSLSSRLAGGARAEIARLEEICATPTWPNREKR